VLEIIEKCREAKSSEVNVKSEVKNLKWSEKLSNIKWTERSKVKWNEVKWSAVLGMWGGEQVFIEKVYRVVSDEKWRTGVKAWVN